MTGISKTGSKNEILERDFITSLAQGLTILNTFNDKSPRMSVTDLAKKLDISRARARRFLLTLEHLGYLHKEKQHYRLTSKVLSLSSSYFSSMPISAIAQPHLEEITEKTEETSSLGILENDMLAFIAQAKSRWILNVGLQVGVRLPAYCTAMGRVILSNRSKEEQQHYLENVELKSYNEKTITDKAKLREILAKTQKQGFSIIDQELELGLRAIAVPVTRGGQVVASISINCQASRVTIKRLKEEFLPLLNRTSTMISSELSVGFGL